MGNSPSFNSKAKTKHQHEDVLLIRANENADHIVSKYQHYHDNEIMKLFEYIRWKLNITLLFRPFTCLSHISLPYDMHQFLYRLTICELLFWAAVITLSISPITWFISQLYHDQPIFKWNGNGVIPRPGAPGSPGNLWGGPTSICFTITFIMSLRNTLWNLLFGFSFERAVVIHKHCGRLSVLIGLLHFFEYRNFYWFRGQCLTGSITLICGILIFITSLNIFRRNCFNIFLIFHWLFLLGFLTSGLIHGATWLIAAVSLFSLDIIYRIYLIFNNRVMICNIKLLPCNVIRIEFDATDFKYDAGQYIFVNIPSISLTEYHPFSISSSPHQSKRHIMIHIRVLGDWTQKLHKFISSKLQTNSKPNWNDEINMLIEGPYGELQVPLHEYQSIIMISGGIGITPLQSIFNEMIHNISCNSSPKYQLDKQQHFIDFIKRIHFVWSVRDPYLVTEFGKMHWAGIQYKNRNPFAIANSKYTSNSANKYLEYESDNDSDINDGTYSSADDYKFGNKYRSVESSQPDFYSPDLLLVQQGSKMVQKTKILTEFYLTRVTDNERKKKYAKQYKLLKFGRPNIEKIIKKAKHEFKYLEELSTHSLLKHDKRINIKNNNNNNDDDDGDVNSEYGINNAGGCCVNTKKGKEICILTCGPLSMIKTVKKYAAKYNIDCHAEVFEF